MTQTHLEKILTRRYDVGREIKFILYKDELLTDPIDLSDYTVVITVIKPDNNFVIENFVGDTVTITDQMEVVTGTGYYCVHVTKDNETIYTGQGEFIIDDVLISDEELESISEVNGLRFPDDFLTVDDHVAVIDDDVTSTDKTWSSSKISYEIDNTSVEVSKTVEGNPVIFTDGANAPLVKCVTDITGYQSGTGTPSPDNVRPIVAYTEGEIEVRGKNLLDPNSSVPYGAGSSSCSVSGDNINVQASGLYTGIVFNKVLPNGTYSISFSFKFNSGGKASVTIVDSDNTTSLWSTGEFTSDITRSGAFTVANGIAHIRFYCTRDNYTGNATISNLMLNTGSSSENYEEFRGTTHTAIFSNSIYQGNVDFVNGEVTTEWAVIASYAGETLPGEWISDRDEYAPGTTPTTGAQVAYELATPTTSSVTPTNLPIKSLSGYNHIESSTGDMEIEYITQDYQSLVDSIEKESVSRTTKLWDAGFTPSPGVWLEYDFGEDLEGYDAIVILFVVSGWEGNNADSVTVYPNIQHLNTNKYYHYITGDYGIQFWHVSGTTYGLGSIDGNYPPQYKAVYGIKY
jgi:hypothetical protein